MKYHYNAPARQCGVWTQQLLWLRHAWLNGKETTMYTKKTCWFLGMQP